MTRAKLRIVRDEPSENKQIGRESTIDDMLEATPPSEIGDGHLSKSQEREQRKVRERANFGTVKQPYAYERPSDGRILPKKPDKRTRIEPEKVEIPTRTGGTVMF